MIPKKSFTYWTVLKIDLSNTTFSKTVILIEAPFKNRLMVTKTGLGAGWFQKTLFWATWLQKTVLHAGVLKVVRTSRMCLETDTFQNI